MPQYLIALGSLIELGYCGDWTSYAVIKILEGTARPDIAVCIG